MIRLAGAMVCLAAVLSCGNGSGDTMGDFLLQDTFEDALRRDTAQLRLVQDKARRRIVTMALNNAGGRVYTEIPALAGQRLVCRSCVLEYYAHVQNGGAPCVGGLIQFGVALAENDGTGSPRTADLIGPTSKQHIINSTSCGLANANWRFAIRSQMVDAPMVGRAEDAIWIWHESQNFAAGTNLWFANAHVLYTVESTRDLERQ